MIAISRADYNKLLQECNPSPVITSNCDYCERIVSVPDQLGRGYIRYIGLAGINLQIFNYQLQDDLHISDEVFGSEWEFGFNLTGNRSGKNTGENFISWGAYEGEGILVTYANAPVLKVDIHFDNSHNLFKLIAETLEELPLEIRRYIEDSEHKRVDDINLITPAMGLTLQKIFHCDYQGKIKQIYLESQCLELVALKLDQLKDPNRYSCRPMRSLSLDDVDRIHLAKKIITDKADYPPSLRELALQVGLNDFKLKAGFREVFGTTVFGYLHQHRMETAKQLLNEQRLNVKEVAQAVGYANQSRFASAFRKQFGVNPKFYLQYKKSV